jgi:hypothetical protein
MRSPFPSLIDPQNIPLCSCCGQHSEWRDGLCSECDCAERNATQADEHDALTEQDAAEVQALLADRSHLDGCDVDAMSLDEGPRPLAPAVRAA